MRFVEATYHSEIKTVEYVTSDGTRLLKTGGTLNWRFNNPGNLVSAGNQPGKIGVGIVFNPEKHVFAIFSSVEAGNNAKSSLLKINYKNYTIPDMIKRYAPKEDGNDSDKYANFIMSESGVTKDQKIGDLDSEKFKKVTKAISKNEGGLTPGTEKWVYVTNVTVSDGSRPVAEVPFKVTLDNTTHEWKTDDYGKLKPIVHTKQGMSITIKYVNSAGKEDVVYSAVAGDNTKNILLTRNFQKFSANTLVDVPKTPRVNSIQKPIDYIVMSGDSLTKIAARYKSSAEEIIKNNGITDANKIYPGQRLTIYGAGNESPKTHQVSAGDTLAKIAKKYDVSVDDLAKQNDITDPNRIYPGQTIMINQDAINKTRSTPTPSNKPQSTDKHSHAEPIVASAPKKSPPVNHNAKLQSVGSKKSGKPVAILPHSQNDAPWMGIVIREAEKWKGSDETIITKTSNYHQLIGYGKLLPTLSGSKNAWCASFVNYCLQEAGYTKSKFPYRAKSFIDDKVNFFEISEPIYGAIATSGHHATFVYGKSGGYIIGLGGNQGGGAVINGSVSGGTIKFSPYKGMRFYFPISYKNQYEISKLNELQDYDANVLNSDILGMTVKVKGKEGTT